MRSAILLTSFVLLAMSVSAQERSYGRSMVINDHGIVATSHVLASQAGAQILARGGSAIDAAITANDERNRRRSLPDLLGREERETLRPECQRLGAAQPVH